RPAPAGPTALALLAWEAYHRATGENRYHPRIEHALAWTLKTRGRTVERKPQIGHDTTLVGWSWANNTHSWLEPTSLFVKALTANGLGAHARTAEATRLLIDRLLPGGGANYGNTRVLQQYLLPHVQPTGLVMWALADQEVEDPRIEASLAYLAREIEQPLGSASIAYALIGLAAHGRLPKSAATLTAAALARRATVGSTYKLALLNLARQQAQNA
ncbi:MAG: hypothetical protein AAF589_02660, partial [Planctomycetota bacterium]